MEKLKKCYDEILIRLMSNISVSTKQSPIIYKKWNIYKYFKNKHGDKFDVDDFCGEKYEMIAKINDVKITIFIHEPKRALTEDEKKKSKYLIIFGREDVDPKPILEAMGNVTIIRGRIETKFDDEFNTIFREQNILYSLTDYIHILTHNFDDLEKSINNFKNIIIFYKKIPDTYKMEGFYRIKYLYDRKKMHKKYIDMLIDNGLRLSCLFGRYRDAVNSLNNFIDKYKRLPTLADGELYAWAVWNEIIFNYKQMQQNRKVEVRSCIASVEKYYKLMKERESEKLKIPQQNQAP